jgi:hypothetical protein
LFPIQTFHLLDGIQLLSSDLQHIMR